MLTIKHIDTDGTETLMEAERVEKVQTGDHFMDGIYLDREPVSSSDMLGQAIQPPRGYRHVIHFAQARSTDEICHEPKVYVMNRFGATVATYRL